MADYAEVRHPGSQTRTTAEKATGTSQGSDDGDNDHEDEDVECGKAEAVRCLSPSGPVGLDALPKQVVDRRVQQGFRFNLLCVGETGIGKSTLVATLFHTRPDGAQASHFHPAVGLRAETHELHEADVALTLTVVSTVGFGDQVDREDGHQPIAAYIDAQFEAFLQEELRVPRAPTARPDSRLHACLYFLAPTGHSLRALDLCALRSLGSRVNVIPLIAKADTLSRAELQGFKARVLGELAGQGVHLYRFPTDDAATAALNAAMNEQLPFAVVGSTDEVLVGCRLVRVRQYGWGTVEVENEEHCDFVKLREMLVCTNMEDLREQTHARHYELYRRRRLRELGLAHVGPGNRSGSGPPCPCPAEAEEPEARRRQFLEACRRKEAQLKQAFARRVKEKEAVLREAERQLQDRFEQLERKQHRETLRLEEKRRALEEEMLAFSKKKTASRMLQSRVSACTSSKKKDKDRKKDQGYRFELLCFDVKACETRDGRKEAEEWEEAYSPRV